MAPIPSALAAALYLTSTVLIAVTLGHDHSLYELNADSSVGVGLVRDTQNKQWKDDRHLIAHLCTPIDKRGAAAMAFGIVSAVFAFLALAMTVGRVVTGKGFFGLVAAGLGGVVFVGLLATIALVAHIYEGDWDAPCVAVKSLYDLNFGLPLLVIALALTIIALLALVLLGGIADEVTPAPAPELPTEPAHEPAVQPKAAPEPVVVVVREPEPEPEQEVVPEPTPEPVVVPEPEPEPAAEPDMRVKYKVGDKVRVRNDQFEEEWTNATVTAVDADGVSNVKCALEGKDTSAEYKFVKLYDWSFKVGDLVRIKNDETDGWKYGTVAGIVGLRIRATLAGMKADANAGHWEICEKYNWKFRVGDLVRMRNDARDKWRFGQVAGMLGGRVRATLAGETLDAVAGHWEHCEAFNWKFAAGDMVRVRTSDEDSWKEARCAGMVAGRVRAHLKGEDIEGEAGHWEQCEHFWWQYAAGDLVHVRNTDDEEWRNAVVDEVVVGRVRATVDGEEKVKVFERCEAFDWKAAAAEADEI
eukprot:Rhum_TRINITY_DN14613_c20_g2::Rhum_TRINITY_DN14613_c20_g2_i1::g.109173::m.109173